MTLASSTSMGEPGIDVMIPGQSGAAPDRVSPIPKARTGKAGTGKTTIAAMMLAAACARGERALFVAFEESPAQLLRDMAAVGIDLGRWVDAGLLRIFAGRPIAYGLELHLATVSHIVEEFAPTVVALDAMTGAQGVLAGSARLAQEADDRRSAAKDREEVERRRRHLAVRTAEADARIVALRSGLEAEAAEVAYLTAAFVSREAESADEAETMSQHRWADPAGLSTAVNGPGR